MDIEQYIASAFPEGLSYSEASQLCISLFCTVDDIPEQLHTQCTRAGLSSAFASLAARGLVIPSSAVSISSITEQTHWSEVISLVFKEPDAVNRELGQAVVERLKVCSKGNDAFTKT